jgi:hypothetical protein
MICIREKVRAIQEFFPVVQQWNVGQVCDTIGRQINESARNLAKVSRLRYAMPMTLIPFAAASATNSRSIVMISGSTALSLYRTMA